MIRHVSLGYPLLKHAVKDTIIRLMMTKNTDPVHSGLAGSVYIFTEINILITAAVKLEA